jgi:hypothetical protein
MKWKADGLVAPHIYRGLGLVAGLDSSTNGGADLNES